MRGEFDAMDAKLFADFNRSSLLGMPAPAIELLKVCGGKMTIPQKGKSALIWFYDVNCAKCKMEAKFFPQVLEEAGHPINFYAVYTGQSKKEWRTFRMSFKVHNPKVNLVHLWDPEIDSDYLKLYGVISTPKLYMVESGGLIIGRRLELDNLPEIFKLDNIISHSNSL
jgi:thiol-disulfide isomerase/thioredoxin